MQVLILAAGMGKRLADLTSDATKCMVKVNGRTLIERALDIVTSYPLNRIVLVIGYRGELVRELIGDQYNGVPVVYVENPIYDKTNNIYSLYLAKDQLVAEDTILIESDLIFTPKVYEKALQAQGECAVLLDKYQSWMDGTAVTLDAKGGISNFIGKDEFDFYKVEQYYKTVNIYRFSREFSLDNYVPFLTAYCSSRGHNEYYENVLRVISFVSRRALEPVILEPEQGDVWYEIDDKQDLHNAETIFSDNIWGYQQRYGGYWRFPYLRDFCYLVNPYFPPKRMVQEFQTYFETLLHDYPSTSKVQELLAAKMFEVKQEYMLVGNGATELIAILMGLFEDKKIGIMTPTFHEYVARSPKNTIVCIPPVNDDFSYTADDVLRVSKQVDVFVLINPDNPSGNFIPVNDLHRLCQAFLEQGKIFILDESFVDFAHGGPANSIISNEVVEKYPNLILVKSISKSYGVPGIRLGILFTAMTNLLAQVKASMPVWNINSYGEFFLQIYGKYAKDYIHACEQICNERDRLYEALSSFAELKALKSEANYILCELRSPYTATEMTAAMMQRYNILLKDCTGKTAFDGREFVRIAVRDEVDNDYLISSLKQYFGHDK